MNKKLQYAAYVLVCSLSFTAVKVHADATPATNTQQSKMKTCNADAKAKSLAGDDRKTYMKTCLSATPPAASTGNSQQQKMKTCNADAKAKSLKGDDRKAYMKTCLSSAPADAAPAASTPPAASAPAVTPIPAK
jgi:psiF repeat